MPTDRLTRVNELLKREIGTALFQILADGEADLSTITITSVQASTNLRNAKVMVSIRDTDQKRHEVLSVLKRHRPELQDLINRNLKIKYTPRLAFELDMSVEKGDHVLQVLSELEQEEGEEDSGQGTEGSMEQGAGSGGKNLKLET
jgi:ribosome-binding factor A